MEQRNLPVLPDLPYASVTDASVAYYKDFLSQKRGTVVLIVAILILVGAWYAASGLLNFAGVLQYLALLMLTAITFVFLVRSHGADWFYKSIAVSWGWYYAESMPLSGFHGSLARVGHSHSVHNVLRDNFARPVKTIGTIQYAIGSGDTMQTYVNSFACVVVGVPLPHVLLTVDKDRFDNHILSAVGGLVYVRLEDTFEDYFGLYVEPGLELEALQLFSEELLKMMLEQWPGYSFECIGGELYVYTEGQIETKKKMAELSSLLEYLLGLRPRLTAMRGSVIAMHQAVKSAD